MSIRRLLKFCFAAMLLLFATLLRGAPPTPEKLREQLAAATAEKYPDADTVTIYECQFVTYQPDGLEEGTNEFCIKVLTEAGRKGLLETSFPFNAKYYEITLPRATIVKPDGRKIEIDVAKNVSVAVDPSSAGSAIYSDKNKVLTLNSPELEIGDALILTLKNKSFKTPFPGIFSDFFALQGTAPIIFSEVTVDAPEKLPLRSIALKSAVDGTVKRLPEKRENGRIIYRWTAENVPQIITEPNMPPTRSVAQRLLVSTVKDWKEISRWYYQLCRPRLDAVDDELKAEVKKITSGQKTDRDKAMALFQFVSQNIRYTGVDGEDRAPGFEPHDVKATFHQRHGVCRDKAGLLVAMLELAGLKAYPVLFRCGHSTVDDEVPASRFNHAIVAWETAPGKYQLMDPTCESTTEFFPAYLANQSYLVARPEGDVLRRSPSPPPETNSLDIDTVAEFDSYGKLRGTTTFRFRGYDELRYRGAFAIHGRDMLRQIFARQLKRAVPGAEITGFEVVPGNARDMSKPLAITVTYASGDALLVTGAASPVPLPQLAEQFGIAAALADNISLESRQHPLRFDTTAIVREKISCRLPELVHLLPPPPEVKRKAPGAEWTRKIENSGNTIRCESVFKIDSLEIPPEQYAELRELRRKQQADLAVLPLIQTRFSKLPADRLAEIFPDADSFVEDEQISIEVKADLSSRIERVTRRRILTYAGMKRYANFKQYYHPDYQKLEISAEVTTPDGRKHKLASKHISELDALWVASAPRYPKEKLKTVALPAVQVGAVVETRVVLESPSRGIFDFVLPVFTHEPTARKTLKLSTRGHNENIESPRLPGVEFYTEKIGGAQVGTWLMTDLPAVPKELNQPPLEMFVPTIFISIGNAKDCAAEAEKAFRDAAAKPSSAVDRLFSEIAVEQGDKAAIVSAIRDAVARKLRAAGPTLDKIRLADITPPETTLHDGYGNSVDRAVVIAALLDRAKIEYEFVAASSLPYLYGSTKSLRDHPRMVFDEVLVHIPESNVYLNDTDQYAVLGSTRHAGTIGMNLKSGRLVAIRPRHNADDTTVTTFNIELAADGSATIDVTQEFCGTFFNDGKRRFSELPPEKIRQFCEQLAAKILPTAKLGKVKPDFSRYPGKIEFNFRVDDFARRIGKELMFELPGYSELASAINASESDRRTPALRERRRRIMFKYRIKFPNGYRMEHRPPSRVELGRRSSGYFTEHSGVMRDQLSVDALLVLPAEFIQSCDYVELANLQRDLRKHFSRRIVLSGERPRRK